MLARANTYQPALVDPVAAADLGKRSKREHEVFREAVTAAARARTVGNFSGAVDVVPEQLATLARVLQEVHRRTWWKGDAMNGSGWTQESSTSIPTAFHVGFEPTELEREHLLQSVITSQALEGVHIGYDEAASLLDEVLREPLAEIG